MSKDLMLMLGSVMPDEFILSELSKAVEEHNLLNTKESKKHVGMFCVLWLSKEITDEQGFENLI